MSYSQWLAPWLADTDGHLLCHIIPPVRIHITQLLYLLTVSHSFGHEIFAIVCGLVWGVLWIEINLPA